MIKKYKTTNTKYGYNYSTGGECSSRGITRSKESNLKRSQTLKGHSVLKESREKMSIKVKQKWKDSDFKKKMSQIHKDIWQDEDYRKKRGEQHRIYLQQHPEVVEKIRQKSLGRKPPNMKIVLQYDMQGNLIREWESVTEAARQLNIHRRYIMECCNKGKKFYYDFVWKYKDS